jgi:signal peptidase II
MKKVKTKINIICSLVWIGVLVIFDQFTKYLAVVRLKGQAPFALIPDVFELRYLENNSAAFGIDLISILQRIFHFSYFTEHPEAFLNFKMSFFVAITVVVVVLLYLLYLKIPQNRRFRYLNWIIIAFISGAIGNCIDRMVNRYVVDFFYFKLINFPIFNVADIYVTVSAVALILLFLFYYQEADFEQIFPSRKQRESHES